MTRKWRRSVSEMHRHSSWKVASCGILTRSTALRESNFHGWVAAEGDEKLLRTVAEQMNAAFGPSLIFLKERRGR